MGSRITNIEPCGKMVLLEFHEVKEKELYKMDKATGLLLQNTKATDEKRKVYATVSKVGPDVDMKTVSFKVGDRVFYNDYDCKMFGDDNTTYGLTKVDSIWASYVESDD